MFRIGNRRVEQVYPPAEPAADDRWIDRGFVLGLLDELCADARRAGADRVADMVLDARLAIRPARAAEVPVIPGRPQ